MLLVLALLVYTSFEQRAGLQGVPGRPRDGDDLAGRAPGDRGREPRGNARLAGRAPAAHRLLRRAGASRLAPQQAVLAGAPNALNPPNPSRAFSEVTQAEAEGNDLACRGDELIFLNAYLSQLRDALAWVAEESFVEGGPAARRCWSPRWRW